MSTDNNTRFDTINESDTTWVLMSTALVMIMIPGIGFFYSGLARQKNALSLVMLSLVLLATGLVQWWLFGYSLAFSESGNRFVGNFENFAFRDVDGRPSHLAPNLPSLVFANFQGMFSAFAPAIIIGSVAERGRILPAIVFAFIWSTLVYDPIACWNWSSKGWTNELGSLDFAGSTRVHISSGVAAFVYCAIVRQRIQHKEEELHHVMNTVLGTVFLWFGWLGFNGGSARGSSVRTSAVILVTNLSAAMGGVTWLLLEHHKRKRWSAVSFCTGVVAGLVAVTAGAGFIGPLPAVLYGITSSVVCRWVALKLKKRVKKPVDLVISVVPTLEVAPDAPRWDDAMDVFAIHTIGGFVGNVLTGVFAQSEWAELGGGKHIPGGWLDGHWMQPAYQLADSAAGAVYSCVVSYIILYLIDKTPGLNLRATVQSEQKGLDDSELGEPAYYMLPREGLEKEDQDQEDQEDDSS